VEIPTYDKFIEPVLRFLADRPEGAKTREAYEYAASILNLSEEQRTELLPSGKQQVYKNRTGWAHDRLKRAGLSKSIRKGFWKLTTDGIQFAANHPQLLSDEQVERLATAFMDVTLSKQIESAFAESTSQGSLTESLPQIFPAESTLPISSVESPDDRLESAVQEIKKSVTEEILEVLAAYHPNILRRLCLMFFTAWDMEPSVTIYRESVNLAMKASTASFR